MSTHIHQHANILSATSRFSPEKFHSRALSLSIYLSLYLSLQASLLYLQRVTERRKGCGSQRENSGKYTQQSVNSKYTVDTRAQLSGRCTGSPSSGEGLHVAQLSASSAQIRSGHRVLATPHREEGCGFAFEVALGARVGLCIKFFLRSRLKVTRECLKKQVFWFCLQFTSSTLVLCVSAYTLCCFISLFSH